MRGATTASSRLLARRVSTDVRRSDHADRSPIAKPAGLDGPVQRGSRDGGMTPDQLRAFYLTVGEKLGGAPRPMAEVRHLSAPGPTGAIALRRCQPEGLTADPRPGMIYVHGGGWVMGSIETHDKTAAALPRPVAASWSPWTTGWRRNIHSRPDQRM